MRQYYIVYPSELYHSGRVGMKWYQHIFGKKRAAKERNTFIHDDYRRAHTSKSVKSMSDSELKSRLNRYQMESNYAKYSNEGKRQVDKIMKTLATATTVTGAVLTIAQNADKIGKLTTHIIDKAGKVKFATI